jgi:hypothetical protein
MEAAVKRSARAACPANSHPFFARFCRSSRYSSLGTWGPSRPTQKLLMLRKYASENFSQ